MQFDEAIRGKLAEQFGYKNRFQVPTLDKVVINMGIGEGVADRTLYKLRNRIERCFNRLKQFRRLATRYCKRRPCFHATVALACSWLHLVKYVDTA